MTEGEKPKDPYQKYKDFQWENPDEFKNGPMSDEKRKCRDIFCCLFFLVFLAACVAEDGNACGKEGAYKDYPYLYFYDVIKNAKKLEIKQIMKGICVKECPKKLFDGEGTVGNSNTKNVDCIGTSNNPSCEINFLNYYESKPILNRICFPMEDDEITYDSTIYRTIEIYDPETKSTFTKLVHKNDVITS